MRNSRPEKNYQSKEKTYLCLSNVKLLYQLLSDKHQQLFLKSLKKNPIRQIIESVCFKTCQIYDYDAFKNFFIYLPDEKDEELYFIKKDDVTRVAKNLKVCIENNWKIDKKHLMN